MTTDWGTFQHAARQHYAATQQARCNAVISIITQKKHDLKAMRGVFRNIADFLMALQQQMVEQASYILDVIETLHPIPIQLGEWSFWIEELQIAITLCERAGLSKLASKYCNDLSKLLYNCGRAADALAFAERAQTFANEAHDDVLTVEAMGSRITLMLYAARYDEAESLLDRLQQTVSSLSPDTHTSAQIAVCKLNFGLTQAVFLRNRGRLTEAYAVCCTTLDWIDAETDYSRSLVAHGYRLRGLFEMPLGKLSEASQSFRHAYQLMRKTGEEFDLSYILGNWGLAYWYMGRLDRAEKLTRRSIVIAKRIRALWQMACQIGNLGLVALSKGDVHRATKLIRRHLEMAIATGLEQEANRARGNLGVTLLYAGETEEATKMLEEDRVFCIQHNLKVGYVNVLANLSLCYVDRGEGERALSVAQEALALSRELQSKPLQVVALRCLAECVTEVEERRQLLLTALGLVDDQRLDKAGCLFGLAEIAKDDEEKGRLWAEATQLLESMGATGWLKLRRPIRILALH